MSARVAMSFLGAPSRVGGCRCAVLWKFVSFGSVRFGGGYFRRAPLLGYPLVWYLADHVRLLVGRSSSSILGGRRNTLAAVRCVHMLPRRWQTSIVTYMSFPGQLVASPPCSSSCRLSPCWFYCGQGPGYFLDVPDATRRGVRLASAGVLVATCCS